MRPLRSDLDVLPAEPAALAASKNAAHYDEVTAGWTVIMGRYLHFGLFDDVQSDFDGATERLVLEAIDDVPLSAANVVLDVGCGTGTAAELIRKRSGCGLLCVTNSEAGATLTRQRLAADDVEVRVADAQRTTYPPGVADLALFLESSHLMSDKRAALASARSALTASGRLVVTDLVAETPLDLTTRELAVLKSVFGNMELVPIRRYCELLEELGFRDIEEEDVSQRAAPTLERWNERCDSYRHQLSQLWSAERIKRFQQACTIVAAAFRRQRAGYAIIRARTP